MKKAPEAFRTISEVSDLLDTPAHVLRFWESKFYQIRPVKRAGGRRYYRPDDVALLAGIRLLLQDQGMTIRGVQKVLQEQGVRHVASLAPDPSVEDSFESGAFEDMTEDDDAPQTAPPPEGGPAVRRVNGAANTPSAPAARSDPTRPTAPLPLPDPATGKETRPGVSDSAHDDAPTAPSAPEAPPSTPEPPQLREPQPTEPDLAEPDGAEPDSAARRLTEPVSERRTAEPPTDLSGAHKPVDAEPMDAEPVDTEPMGKEPAAAEPGIEPAAKPAAGPALPEPARARPPVPPPAPAFSPPPAPGSDRANDPAAQSEPARIAQTLRNLPRGALDGDLDEVTLLARRLDTLLDRMSDASGAGRW